MNGTKFGTIYNFLECNGQVLFGPVIVYVRQATVL